VIDAALEVEGVVATAPVSARREALAHLATAHNLLLANDGQARALRARKFADVHDALSAPEVRLFRDHTHEESLQVNARFVEAQLYIRHALDALGVRVDASGTLLPVIGRAEAYLDSVFDLWAAKQAQSAVAQNAALGAKVRAAHEAIRTSSPELATVERLELPEEGLAVHEAVGQVLGLPGVGSPRFWSTGKWVLVILQATMALAVVAGMVYVLFQAQ